MAKGKKMKKIIDFLFDLFGFIAEDIVIEKWTWIIIVVGILASLVIKAVLLLYIFVIIAIFLVTIFGMMFLMFAVGSFTHPEDYDEKSSVYSALVLSIIGLAFAYMFGVGLPALISGYGVGETNLVFPWSSIGLYICLGSIMGLNVEEAE